MKNSYLFLFMIITIGLITFSCKSDDDGGGGGSAAEGTITAKVNGSNFGSESMMTSGQFINAGGTSTLSIIGTNMEGKAISFTAVGVSETGTYQIGGGANISIAASYTETSISNPMNSQVWQAPFDETVAGEISFSELSSTKAVGTFSFQCKNVNGDGSIKNITEGSFNVNLQ